MKYLISAALGLAVLTSAASAQDVDGAIKARKAHMQLYQHQLGILGGMAKGEIDYNAELAAAVAGDLAKLSTLMQASYWPPGSDNSVTDKTRLLPTAWEKIDQVISISQDLGAAAAAMEAVAGDGLDGIRGAIGPIGKACGACHEITRAPKK